MLNVDYYTLMTVVSLHPDGLPKGHVKERGRGYMGHQGTERLYDGGVMFAGEKPGEKRPFMTTASSDVAGLFWQTEAQKCAAMQKANRDYLADGDAVYRCTRLDVKADYEHGTLDAVGLREGLLACEWGHRPPQLTAYRSETDTLYIGAPGSPVRWRIYQKRDGVIRYEVQIRNGKDFEASQAWAYLVGGGDLPGVWAAFAGRVPGGIIPAIDGEGMTIVSQAGERQKAEDWLYGSVLPAMLRLESGISLAFLERAYDLIMEKTENEQ